MTAPATAPATAPTFTEEQIQTKMKENDYCNYRTTDAEDIDVDTVIDWLSNNSDSRYEELIADASQEYLDEQIEALREEAIEELTEEATPESVKRERRIIAINEKIAELRTELNAIELAWESTLAEVGN